MSKEEAQTPFELGGGGRGFASVRISPAVLSSNGAHELWGVFGVR